MFLGTATDISQLEVECDLAENLATAPDPGLAISILRSGQASDLATAVLHQSPDKRGVPLPVKMVSQLTQTWHSQVRSFC